jgi:hypothetical protein
MSSLRQVGEIGEELQAPVLVGGKKLPQEHSPKQACEDALGQEVAGPTRDPALSIRREPAPRNDAVHMRMMGQRLAPSVQDSGEADLGAEMLGSRAMVLSVSAAASNRIP